MRLSTTLSQSCSSLGMFLSLPSLITSFFFFFNATSTTEIYTLSLHDALPIWRDAAALHSDRRRPGQRDDSHSRGRDARRDRKSTRLNSSHQIISYAVFCLKKKNIQTRAVRGGKVTSAQTLSPTV